MIFVDSSAVVAILAADPDAAALAAKLESDAERISAGHVIVEASMRLASLFGVAPAAADGLVTRLLREAAISVVPITEDIGHAAVAAFDRYGRGRGAGKSEFRRLPIVRLRQGARRPVAVQGP